VPSVSIPYECSACNASCAAVVTDLDDPSASIDAATQDTLRRLRASRVQAGEAPEGDPVAELAAKILQERAREELLYATCPRCGAKNPEGVVEHARRERRWTAITAAILLALAAGAWFVRWFAIGLPVIDLVVIRPLAIRQARQSGQPVRWLSFASSVVVDVALIVLVVLVPRAAPGVPLVSLVSLLVRRLVERDDRRWREAAGRIRFEEA
jgi:hypothetical protein